MLCSHNLLVIRRQFVNKSDICEETYCTTHLHTLMYRKTSLNKHLRIYYVLKVKSFTKKNMCVDFPREEKYDSIVLINVTLWHSPRTPGLTNISLSFPEIVQYYIVPLIVVLYTLL